MAVLKLSDYGSVKFLRSCFEGVDRAIPGLPFGRQRDTYVYLRDMLSSLIFLREFQGDAITDLDFVYYNASYYVYILSLYKHDNLRNERFNRMLDLEGLIYGNEMAENFEIQSYYQFKKERQRDYPRKKGQTLRKGELTHRQAYDEYLDNYEGSGIDVSKYRKS